MKSQSLGKIASIETQSRRKFVKAAKDHLATLKGSNHDEISRLNARNTMERNKALGFNGPGRLLLEAASNLDPETAWHKHLHEIEVAVVALERRILAAEKFLAE